MAVEIAKTATWCGENRLGNILYHLVLFERSKDEAIRAKTILNYVRGWRGTQIFAGGKGVEIYRTLQVLDCYIQSASCDDHRAHCLVTVDQKMHPCRFILGFHDREILKHHPSTIKNQLQAMAVRRGCEWCPHFTTDNFGYAQVGRIKFDDLFD